MNWFNRKEEVESSATILEVKEHHIFITNLNYKTTPCDITIQYHAYGTIYTKTICAKSIDFMQIKELKIGNKIKICYEEEHPENVYFPDYTYLSSWTK